VHQENADRRFMARVLSPFFRERLSQPHHELVAKTVRVALNLEPSDPFGADHVRKAVEEPPQALVKSVLANPTPA
jgi:hypothetical protein